MLWVIALLPVLVYSLLLLGIDTLRIVALCVAFSISFDLIANKIFPSKDHTQNWSSVSLAVLFAFLLPVNTPWWLILTGCFILIIGVKKLFGGLGAYPVHPVALSFSILLVFISSIKS